MSDGTPLVRSDANTEDLKKENEDLKKKLDERDNLIKDLMSQISDVNDTIVRAVIIYRTKYDD